LLFSPLNKNGEKIGHYILRGGGEGSMGEIEICHN
jgi:hypothetical protein